MGSRCPQRDVDLERAIKMSYLMPNLIWRKPPSSSGTKAAVMQSICRRRLNMACKMDIVGLVRDYERDVLMAKELEPTPAGRRTNTAIGHMGNEAFVIAVTRYFGQSSYITRSMAGLYFGKKGEQVNENATNLCCAHLPGGGFRILHDQVKTLIITFLHLAGVEADEESALWMLGK
ncbi:hypothetical protein THAOC_03432, partial [Thalassiosira oceanica]